ncbi:hypothetical protein SSYM_1624 [Serratia symbiotica str. Tucson]|uniref:Uncharacterized protein n=1 Tax=Serratia symbiotica str. Tucson TaxID=914128 RepID=E9CMP6_9GAMM|nr:hypothetical protein SSYM_1624 [Serratia symbiotica str. Tucson]
MSVTTLVVAKTSYLLRLLSWLLPPLKLALKVRIPFSVGVFVVQDPPSLLNLREFHVI